MITGAPRYTTINPYDRVSFVGRTGTGKTYLGRALCSSLTRLVVLDSKGTLGKPDWRLTNWDDPNDDLIEQDTFRLRVRTPEDGNWDDFLRRVYEAENVTVFIDEAYGVTEGAQPSPQLRALVTRGRELGIGVWSATQRPSFIPLILISESDWYFIFQLRLQEDKKRMESFVGEKVWIPLKGHNCLVYNDHWDDAMVLKEVNIVPMSNVARPAQTGFQTNDNFGGGNVTSFESSRFGKRVS